jgi:hypothetical protein
VTGLDGEAIPAVLFGALTAFGAVWKVVDFMRDKRVSRAESDAAIEHERYQAALDMNRQLQAELYSLKVKADKPT